MGICRTYLSKQFCIITFFPYLTQESVFFQSKQKTYILSKNVLMKTCIPYSSKKFCIIIFFYRGRSHNTSHSLWGREGGLQIVTCCDMLGGGSALCVTSHNEIWKNLCKILEICFICHRCANSFFRYSDQ